MSETNDNGTGSKPPQNEDEINTNDTTSIPNFVKTDVVLSNIKNDTQNKEVVLDIDVPDVNTGQNDKNREYMVYGLYGNPIRPPKTTWVMYEGTPPPNPARQPNPPNPETTSPNSGPPVDQYGQPVPGAYPNQYGPPGPGGYPNQYGPPGPGAYPNQYGPPGPGGYPNQYGPPGPGGYPNQYGPPGPGGYPNQYGPPGPGAYPNQYGPPGPGPYPNQYGPPGTEPNPGMGGGRALPEGETPLDYDSSRNGFVRLVLSIVLAMIIVTATFNACVLFTDGLREFFEDYGRVLALPAMGLMIALNYSIACSPCTRLFPCNIVILVLAVIGMSFICGYMTLRYNTQIVFYAVIATCIVVFVCLLLAFTNFDFTAWMIYVVVISAAFGAIALVAMLTMMISGTYMKMVHLGILLVGTLISVVFLTIELQMVLGGKAVEIGEDDYALAAFLLYTSIVDVFLKLLQILGIFDSM